MTFIIYLQVWEKSCTCWIILHYFCYMLCSFFILLYLIAFKMPEEPLRPSSPHLHLRNPRHLRLKLTAQFLHVILGGNDSFDFLKPALLMNQISTYPSYWNKSIGDALLWPMFSKNRICWILKINQNWEHKWIVIICLCFQRIMNTPDGCSAIDLEHPAASRSIDSFFQKRSGAVLHYNKL